MDTGDTLFIVESTEEDVNKHAPLMSRGGIPLSNSPLRRKEGCRMRGGKGSRRGRPLKLG
jgi:hypothetical protein